jgi:hypothetical protein
MGNEPVCANVRRTWHEFTEGPNSIPGEPTYSSLPPKFYILRGINNQPGPTRTGSSAMSIGMALDCTIDRYSSPAVPAAVTTSSLRQRSASSSSHLTLDLNSSALYSWPL